MQISFTINIKLVVQILYFEFFTNRLLNPRKSPKWLKKFYRSIKGSKTIKENSPKSIEVQRRWANHSEIAQKFGPYYMVHVIWVLTQNAWRPLFNELWPSPYLKITVDISEFMILNMVYQQIVRSSFQMMNRVLVRKNYSSIHFCWFQMYRPFKGRPWNHFI